MYELIATLEAPIFFVSRRGEVQLVPAIPCPAWRPSSCPLLPNLLHSIRRSTTEAATIQQSILAG